MTLSRQELARVALRGAFELRRKANLPFEVPLCAYDVAEEFGLEVWFVKGATFGGMFAKEYGRLFVPVERPPGRKAFTCAHELAHWWFDHGSRVDDLDFDKADHEVPEERLANLCAAYFLMPRHAVVSEFYRRGFAAERCDPIELYAVASQFGVGYQTLIKHLRWSLNLLSHSRMGDLCAVPPKEIRRMVLGANLCRHLVFTDTHWHRIAIDLEVGDMAVVPIGTDLRGAAVQEAGNCRFGKIVKAIASGLCQAIDHTSNWSAMIRVSRREFAGRGAYRHLEDPDINE